MTKITTAITQSHQQKITMIFFKTILKLGLCTLFFLIFTLSLTLSFTQKALASKNYYSDELKNSFNNLQDSQKYNLNKHLNTFSLFQSDNFKQLKKDFTQLLFVRLSKAPEEQVQCPTLEPCIVNAQKKYLQARRFLFGKLHLKGSSKKTYSVDGIYCSRTFTNKDFVSNKGLGPRQIPDHKVLNTEHIWPQSRFSPRFPFVSQLIDLHILYPSHAATNSQRGNRYFGKVVKDTHLVCGTARMGIEKNKQEIIFEPPNKYKGNVARAMFYFSVRYRIAISKYRQRMFKKWHNLDPVDVFEKNRNEVIFKATGTRNPFIDEPKSILYVSDSWGE